MRSMNRELAVPVLHMRGESDPYVLADPVHRSLPYAPNGQFVALRGVGHYGHEEDPTTVNEQLRRFTGRR